MLFSLSLSLSERKFFDADIALLYQDKDHSDDNNESNEDDGENIKVTFKTIGKRPLGGKHRHAKRLSIIAKFGHRCFKDITRHSEKSHRLARRCHGKLRLTH
jgi:hypothetical protein